MNFKDRTQYIEWVYQNYISCISSWNRVVPSLPRVHTPRTLSERAERFPLVASLGLGVVGGVQIGLRKSLPRGPVIWLAASRAERRALQRLLVKPLVAVVPYPLDAEKINLIRRWRGTVGWRKARAHFYSDHGLEADAPTFFFSGRIIASKGLRALVELAERQRFKIQLVTAGLRERSYWRTISDSPYCRTVDLGRIGPDRNFRSLTFVDSCVALSTDASEDFGFLPRQALALGTPSLITNWGGLSDIALAPRGLERKLLRRFDIGVASGGLVTPELSALDLRRYFGELSELGDGDRQLGGEALLQKNLTDIRTGLGEALALRSQLLRDAPPRSPAPVLFRDLSREIVLACGSRGLLDAAVCFPKKQQLQIMTGSSLL